MHQAGIPGDTTADSRDQMTLCISCVNGIAAVDPETLATRAQRQSPAQQRVAQQIADAGSALFVSLSGISSGATEVLALERDGATRWRTQLPSQMVQLRTDGEALFAFESDPTIWRLDPRSGRMLWARPSDKPIVDVVAISDGITAIVRPEDILLLDGAGRALLTRPRNPHVPSFTVRDSRLLSCHDDGTLHAIDIRSGRELWWAQVSVANEECAVLGATNESVLVEGAGRLMALDTTRAAPRPPAVTIRGRFEDRSSDPPKVRGVSVHVGNQRVRTDARGRFIATVRAHGPIDVRVDDESGPQSRAIVWPDGHARHHVELDNYISDSCH